MADSAVSAFEQIKHTDEQGEYWLARELGKLLGYTKWQNFLGVVHEAMEVCRVQGGTTEGLITASSNKSLRPWSAKRRVRLSPDAPCLLSRRRERRRSQGGGGAGEDLLRDHYPAV